MTNRVSRITKLLSVLDPSMLEVIDESYLHRGHAGVDPSHEETHLRIKIKADFGALSLMGKHRKIHELVKEEFKRGLHALSIDTNRYD